MSRRSRCCVRVLLLFALLALTTGQSVRSEEKAAPAESSPAETAPDGATDTAAVTLEQRVAGLEAYINNTDPGAAPSPTPNQATKGVPGPGHNAWMMISAALVLFMTLPGLALFYGGLVRKKNVLSVIAQCFGCAGIATILWVMFGYTLVFGEHPAGSPGNPVPWLLGNLNHLFLANVTSAPDTNYSYWVSENLFSMYQLMFAIITPGLIVGAIAERMKYSAIMLFITLWLIIVYFPLAHMVWGIDGLMNGVWNPGAKIRAIDFAGGTVVHMSSGWSALILCLLLGPRKGFGKTAMAPHSMVLVSVGTGMLWVGWYGFNAGSALAADGVAANAFVTTTICAAVASFVWPAIEYVRNGKPSILGFCSGAVAGLVVITPACGFVSVPASFLLGILAGVTTYVFCTSVKRAFKYDDALDTFGVHAAGGTLGALLTGFFATKSVNSNLAGPAAVANKLSEVIDSGLLWLEQLKAMGLTIVMSVVATLVIAAIVKSLVGLRPTSEQEDIGLDLVDHGEVGYEI